MRIITAEEFIAPVKRLCRESNVLLPSDVRQKLEEAKRRESFPTAQAMLADIVQNFELAEHCGLPICQDTGMTLLFLEVGSEVHITGDLEGALNEGVRQGYAAAYLRKSIVADPLRRSNTNDNTPAAIYVERIPGTQVKITVAPKGFGSENMSRLSMLKPSDGRAGVIDFVLKTVSEAGPNPCPPVILGVGIGGNFDKVSLAAKKALLRPLGQPHPDPYYAELEQEILSRVNALGIGPQGFGGYNTCLNVAVTYLPTHIAGLPVAVNINCHVARHQTEEL